jgi:hypothetical protein
VRAPAVVSAERAGGRTILQSREAARSQLSMEMVEVKEKWLGSTTPWMQSQLVTMTCAAGGCGNVAAAAPRAPAEGQRGASTNRHIQAGSHLVHQVGVRPHVHENVVQLVLGSQQFAQLAKRCRRAHA